LGGARALSCRLAGRRTGRVRPHDVDPYRRPRRVAVTSDPRGGATAPTPRPLHPVTRPRDDRRRHPPPRRLEDGRRPRNGPRRGRDRRNLASTQERTEAEPHHHHLRSAHRSTQEAPRSRSRTGRNAARRVVGEPRVRHPLESSAPSRDLVARLWADLAGARTRKRSSFGTTRRAAVHPARDRDLVRAAAPSQRA
jgi:hypothetical protein